MCYEIYCTPNVEILVSVTTNQQYFCQLMTFFLFGQLRLRRKLAHLPFPVCLGNNNVNNCNPIKHFISTKTVR